MARSNRIQPHSRPQPSAPPPHQSGFEDVYQQRTNQRNEPRNDPRNEPRNDRNESSDGREECISLLQRLRRTYRKLLGAALEKTKVSICANILLLLMTISRLIAGAVKINSECRDEYYVALYLFVKAWSGLFLHIGLLVLINLNDFKEALDNLFVQIWLIIHATFTIIWFSIGNSWVIGNYNDMKRDCPKEVEDWDFHFINFALFLNVVDLIGIAIFLFYVLFRFCKRKDDVANENTTPMS